MTAPHGSTRTTGGDILQTAAHRGATTRCSMPWAAARHRTRLPRLNQDAIVSIVGAGLTGIELAAEVAQQHPQLRVRLISRGFIAGDLSPSGAHAVRTRLEALGVDM